MDAVRKGMPTALPATGLKPTASPDLRTTERVRPRSAKYTLQTM